MKLQHPFLFTRKRSVHCSFDEGKRRVEGKQYVKWSMLQPGLTSAEPARKKVAKDMLRRSGTGFWKQPVSSQTLPTGPTAQKCQATAHPPCRPLRMICLCTHFPYVAIYLSTSTQSLVSSLLLKVLFTSYRAFRLPSNERILSSPSRSSIVPDYLEPRTQALFSNILATCSKFH